MPRAVNLREIYFLEECHFFVEPLGSWGSYLIEVVELNSRDKHRSLAKIKQTNTLFSHGDTKLAPSAKRRQLLNHLARPWCQKQTIYLNLLPRPCYVLISSLLYECREDKQNKVRSPGALYSIYLVPQYPGVLYSIYLVPEYPVFSIIITQECKNVA